LENFTTNYRVISVGIILTTTLHEDLSAFLLVFWA